MPAAQIREVVIALDPEDGAEFCDQEWKLPLSLSEVKGD